MDAIRILEDEVRELVRRRGLDPGTEPDAVRRLVGDAAEDYQARALSGSLPTLRDMQDSVRIVADAVAGFGPLQPLLDDDSIEEIWINAPVKHPYTCLSR